MDLNPFRLCASLKFLGYSIVLIVLALVGVSYYAVVVLTLGPHVLDGGAMSLLSIVVLIFFHILLLLLSWSYVMVLLRDPGTVPDNWKQVPGQNTEVGTSANSTMSLEVENMENQASSSRETTGRIQEIGYCSRCRNGKPPRCHHCSVCQRCVLKMDHHCIWIAKCVGAQNYKFFLLFVFYTFLETVTDTLVLLPHFVKFFRGSVHHSDAPGKLAVKFLAFVLNLAFALSLFCFVVIHTSLLLKNTSAVEVHETRIGMQWKYDLGWRKNIEQVFGTRKLFWMFPFFSKDDLERIPALHGIDFPTSPFV